MTNYNIEKKTPASNWYTIHREFDKESAEIFLFEMSQGGYDRSGTDGYLNETQMIASHYDGGDLYEFRAVELENNV